MMLSHLKVVELGDYDAVRIAGRLLADLGANVHTVRPAHASLRAALFSDGKTLVQPDALEPALTDAALILSGGQPAVARNDGHHPGDLHVRYPSAVIAHISPFGLTGPDADRAASDLTLFAGSGIARILTGQVDDPEAEPPQRPVDEQSGFISGFAAVAASLAACYGNRPGVIDVSAFEALATLAITDLTQAINQQPVRPRKRNTDGNGATVCVLPCSDGYVAISPREEHQWQSWLGVIGNPAWGREPRFARKSDRVANWDALYALLCAESVKRERAKLASTAQAAHVPAFALMEPSEHLDNGQLDHRQFFKAWHPDPEIFDTGERSVRIPNHPFGISRVSGGESNAADTRESTNGDTRAKGPLAGVRVLDFSWVIAGPTTTRYLAALGADVIKVEAPGRGDPARGSELHTVLGERKRAIQLDLKSPAGQRIAVDLAMRSDVLIENFATGVMARFGLDAETLQAAHPGLIYLSASGMGRTGPQSGAVAYGTLLQGFSGFAWLNGVPDRIPRVGMAWLDPMCALLLTAVTSAALQARQIDGRGTRVDLSMVEAMLWAMSETLAKAQLGERPVPQGNASSEHVPHGAYRCAGKDQWLALAVTGDAEWRALVELVPALKCDRWESLDGRRSDTQQIDAALENWLAARDAEEVAEELGAAGIPASFVAGASDLARSAHLQARGFWRKLETGHAPGLPWQSPFVEAPCVAPGLGEHTDEVLREVLRLDDQMLADANADGAFG
ncbi:MAG: CoA transferase [Pseudomonadota bacterium]